MKASTNKTSIQNSLAIFTIVLGVLIMVYGIVVEDEPTAVALLLIVTGTVWFFINRFRVRKMNEQNSPN